MFQLELPDPPTRLDLDDARSLLEQLAAAGYRVPSSCRNGNCGLCHAELLAGAVSIRGQHPLTHSGPIALCVAVPRSDLRLDISQVEPPHKARVHIANVQVLASGDDLQLRLPAGRQAAAPAGCRVALLLTGRAVTATLTQQHGRAWTLLPAQTITGVDARQPLALLYPLTASGGDWQLAHKTLNGEIVLLDRLTRAAAEAAAHWYRERFPASGYWCAPGPP